MNVSVQVSDGITPGLQRMLLRLRSREPWEIVGREMGKVFRAHFAAKDMTPNRKGWHRTHFWGRIRRVTAYDPVRTMNDSSTVVVADPALGGPLNGPLVRPHPPRRMLAIPMRDEAYGSWPSWPNMQRLGLFIFRGKGTETLGRKGSKGKKARADTRTSGKESGGVFLVRNDGDKLQFFYKLVPFAQLKKDPTALPTPATIGAGLLRAVQLWARVADPTRGTWKR